MVSYSPRLYPQKTCNLDLWFIGVLRTPTTPSIPQGGGSMEILETLKMPKRVREHPELSPVKSKPLQQWREDEWTDDIYGDVYRPEGRAAGFDNDEIADWEVAFMEGYDLAA